MHSFWEILLFLPTVGALIGYVCKWMAIRMLFAPDRYVGIGPVGWQGVVQRRAPKFAAGVADTVMGSGIRVEKLLERVSPDELAGELAPLLDQAAPTLLRTALDEVKPGTWDAMAEPVRVQLAGQIARDARRLVATLAERLRPTVVEQVDMKGFVVAQLSGENANRLARLFQRVGARELRVVIWYGAVLGFLIGLVEVGFYAVLEKWWLLPLVGALDGVVNNWLAIQMIFRPRERTVYLGIFPFQGLFPARQEEISRDYGRMLADEVLTPADFVRHLGPNARTTLRDAALAVVEREALPLVTALSGMLGVALTPDLHARLVRVLEAKLTELVPEHLPRLEARLKEQLAVADTLEKELQAMPKQQFETVLRGVFEEDEWILVALGGVLGGAIGLLQGALVLWLE